MTNYASGGAREIAPTHALYTDLAPLLDNDVRTDLVGWLDERWCVTGSTPLARRKSCEARVHDKRIVELLLGLHSAACPPAFLARGGAALAESRFIEQLETAQALADKLSHDLDVAFQANDIHNRLIIYRLELKDCTVVADARDVVGEFACESVGIETEVLLALGLALLNENSWEWRTVQEGGMRAALVRRARELLGPKPNRQAVMRALSQAADDEAVAEDRAGIVRMAVLPGPQLVVLRSVQHLPGRGDDGSKASASNSFSNARSEFAPIASVPLPLIHGVDVRAVAATLKGEFPWLAETVETLLADLVGRPWVRIKPTLLLGSPGCGKTRLARRMGEVLGLDVTLYACAGVHDGAFGGTSRQWSTGRACVPLQAVKRSGTANPLVLLDELEKAGTRVDNGRLVDVLIPMLEPESCARFVDPYLECPVDLNAVSYLATANGLPGIPEPLLDRLRVLRVPEPRAEHLEHVTSAIVRETRQDRGLDALWMPDLAGDELDLLRAHWRGGSLRLVRRLVDAVLAARETLAARH